MRMDKNFIKDVLDKNFGVILGHIESKVEKNVYLTEINANIDNLKMRVQPKDGEKYGSMPDIGF